VSWTPGDNKTGFSPLHLINPINPIPGSPSPTTEVSVSGSDPELSLTFTLNPEVAQAYYDEIGPMRDWQETTTPIPGAIEYGYLNWPQLKSLSGDLYSLSSVKEGKRVTCTMSTILRGWRYILDDPGNLNGPGHYELGCEETLTDIGVFKNIIRGSMYAECNIVRADLPNDATNMGNLSQLGFSYSDRLDSEIVMAFNCRISAGFVTSDHQPNPKLQSLLTIAIGQLPNTAVNAPAITNFRGLFNETGGFGTIGIGPIYVESNSAIQSIGWPCYGAGYLSGVFRDNGEFKRADNFGIYTPPPTNGFGTLGDRLLPPISTPVDFTATLS
jgi:hypothetical protein